MQGLARCFNFRQLRGGVKLLRAPALRSMSSALVYDAPGDPEKVLEQRLTDVGSCNDDEVKIKMLAAPLNPSDINTVQGKYPIQPKLPGGIPGHEGVGEIVEVGSKVEGMQAGDWVVPLEPAQGTWRTLGVFKAAHWHVVPNDLPLEDAATICINPPTAVAMLENFVDMKPGDVVIQNGANSAVGQAVIQLAKAMGLKSINIIRDRPDWDDAVSALTKLGADVVTTEEKLKQDVAAAGLPPAALALNCVGGSASTAVAKMLRQGGVMVTYGGMSMQPVTIPTTLLIFKDITCKGFWLSGDLAKQLGPKGKAQLYDRVVPYIQSGQLHTRCQAIPFSDWKVAIERSQAGFHGDKVMLKF